MIKVILKKVIVAALKQFYFDIRIKGEPIEESGPLLLVANHPNDLIDPLVITYAYPQTLWYLAKSGIFKGKIVTAVLKYFRLLPIYRRQDQGEETWRNEETFRAVTKELSQHGSVLIFPEGLSTGERRLSKIKTGAARMALQAEALNDFNLGLLLQPIGITYSNTGEFKSSVTVRVGKSLKISEWRQRYETDALVTVKELTEIVEREIRKVTVEVLKASDENLVENIAWLYRSAGRVLDDQENYEIISSNVIHYNVSANDLRQQVLDQSNQLRLLADEMNISREQLVLRDCCRWHLLLLAPLVIFGVLINYWPYKLVAVTASRNNNILNAASRALLSALLVFPFWYLLIALVVTLIGNSFLAGSVAFLMLFILGHYTNKYWQSIKIIFLQFGSILGFSNYQRLVKSRDELIKELDALRIK